MRHNPSDYLSKTIKYLRLCLTLKRGNSGLHAHCNNLCYEFFLTVTKDAQRPALTVRNFVLQSFECLQVSFQNNAKIYLSLNVSQGAYFACFI